MVDLITRTVQSSPPDRRLLAQLTNDPKLIRYLENLGIDAAVVGPGNLEVLLQLINDAAEVAGSAQGTANRDGQLLAELERLMQSIDSQASALARALSSLAEVAGQVVQPPDAQIRRLARRVDDIDVLLLDIRPPIFPVQPAPTPPFAPAAVSVTAAYSVLAAPPYQPLTVRADATSTAFTVTLPATPTLLQLVNIKKIDATANVVTVSGGAINIDGSVTAAIGSQYTNMQVQFNGATWDVL